MSSFLHSKEHDLILSIGSGGVTGAVVELRKHSKPRIAHTHESIFLVKQGVTSAELVTNMLSSVHKVVHDLSKEYKKRIRVVHVVFSSPWFSSFSKALTIKKEESFLVTEKVVEKLVEEQKAFHSDHSELVEKAVSHIRLNGYETSEPYGKRAKTLDVSVYASTVPGSIKEKIESEIYKTVHAKSVLYHTFPFLAWNAVNALFSPKEDFLFLDIGGEVSDVLLVRRGAIHSTVSFPIGVNHLLRKAALGFDTTPELASSIVSLYATDAAEEKLREKTAALVSAFGEEWAAHFRQAVSVSESGNQEHFLPQKAFLVSAENLAKMFGDMISKQTSSVTILSQENLSQFVEFGSNEVPNIFLALDTVYLNSRFADGESVYN